MKSLLRSPHEHGIETQVDMPPAPITLPMGQKAYDRGTTTLSFVYQGGIIVAVDSRASRGSFVASSTVEKWIPVNDRIITTMAGTAADCAFWAREITRQCRLFELRNKQPITVTAASKIYANILYQYKDYGLGVGTQVCGFDGDQARIYYVEDGGMRFEGKMFSVGSGSTYALSVLDAHFDYEMDDEAAYDLGRRAIYHAVHRDIGSGGIATVIHLRPEGWRIVSRTDVDELREQYEPRRMELE